MIKNLAEFLSKNKKISVTIQSIATAMALIHSSPSLSYDMDIELVNALQDRPIVENFAAGEGRIQYMELGEEQMSASLQEHMEPFTKGLSAYQMGTTMPGVSDLYSAEAVGLNNDLCFITHKQVADVSAEGFYEFSSSTTSVAYPKHLVDFFIKSHEGAHCASFFETQGDTPLDANLYSSLREVSSDLGAVIDYMRVTGNNDLYTDFVKPLRMSGISYQSHRTTWALDEILEDVDPQLMMHQEAKDIPKIVDMLVKKHILAEDGKTIDLGKSAGRLLDAEVRAGTDIMNGEISESNFADVTKLKSDMVETVHEQVERYKDSLNPGEYEMHLEDLQADINRYDLPSPTEKSVTSATMLDKNISDKTFVDYYLGR